MFFFFVFVGKFVIVIDDFGYCLYNENQVLVMFFVIFVVVLFDLLYVREMVIKVYNSGYEVLIYFLMVLLSK